MKEIDEKPNRIEYETQSFYTSIAPFGSADIRTAIEFFIDVGLSGEDLAEEVDEFSDNTDTKLSDIDVCYVAYDYVLQLARNKIDMVIGYDFCNDLKHGTEFYTYGNYMCTSYDYSDEAVKELTDKIKESTEEQKEELKEDIFVIAFLKNVDIDTHILNGHGDEE